MINGLKVKVGRGKPKTKLLEEKFGGKWKYMGFGGGWRCDDKSRYVIQTYSCYDDLDTISFPPSYYMYDKTGKSQRIYFMNESIFTY